MSTIYRRAYRLRRATPRWGVVDLIYSFDGFILIVPQGVRVDEEFLKRAVLQGVIS
jgi:hypothetical protein